MGDVSVIRKARMGTGDTSLPLRRAAVASGSSLAGLAMMASAAPLDPALFTFWLVDYRSGPVRRGLLGTVGDLIAGPVDVQFAATASAVITACVVVGLSIWLACVAVGRDGIAWDRALIGAAVLFSAAGLPFVAERTGHLDSVTMLVMVIAAAAVTVPVRGAMVAAGIIMCAAVLVHETSLVTRAVWVAAFAAHHASVHGRNPWRAALTVFGPAVAVWAVSRGWVPAPTPAAFASQLAAGPSDIPVNPPAVDTLYATAGDNVRFAASYFVNRNGLAKVVLAAVAVSPAMLASWAVLRDRGIGWRDLHVADRSMFAAAAVPLLLHPLAVDYGRWWATAGLLVAASSIAVLRRSGGRHVGQGTMWLVGLAPAAAIVTGPISDQAFLWLT